MTSYLQEQMKNNQEKVEDRYSQSESKKIMDKSSENRKK